MAVGAAGTLMVMDVGLEAVWRDRRRLGGPHRGARAGVGSGPLFGNPQDVADETGA